MTDPTATTYEALNRAYAFLNDRLFSGTLPACLITMQRKAKTYGYFAPQRFGGRDSAEITDEIALNPSHFKERSDRESLSTLAHEMAHLWQQHYGKPSRTAYHNKEWAAKMIEIGLHPSDTGQPGGKQTGQKVSHYIIDGGPYCRAYAELAAQGFPPLYVELWSDADARKAKKKAASKTKYTCPDCAANAWAKPGTKLICGDCETAMEAEESESEGEDGGE
ncbi:SprT-like domain-containing protein [Microvirga sesbaniae]|uniref:SprT-like domain-containing protein n=1 Tax=Microvirga sesbaniae TaxID=681392 RepID=UPI0021C629D3|nr:SprT-like domain-containing protein [Microvirga sp. HBU67692]